MPELASGEFSELQGLITCFEIGPQNFTITASIINCQANFLWSISTNRNNEMKKKMMNEQNDNGPE